MEEEEKGWRSSDAPAPSVVRFGPYELDLRSAELRKNNFTIRLQDQPFQILVALLERPGELGLREEIRQRLWPNGTVVEFDHSINAAVKRLRDVLRESAEKPRYIETLARRGYRFIGTVEGGPMVPVELLVDQPPAAIGVPNGAGDSARRTVERFASGTSRYCRMGASPSAHPRIGNLVRPYIGSIRSMAARQ